MALNKVAAAYLSYFAYIDDALDAVQPSDFVAMLKSVPSGAANGPWSLVWGPAVNNGVLAYVAQGSDGSYALAFRGTDVDGSVAGAFENVLADADAVFQVPWLYPQQAGAPLQISAGINDALALVIALTDPTTDLSLLDYLRGLAAKQNLQLMVTGHSLGGALAVAATAWLQDQLPKLNSSLKFTLWPHTFAAPTMWNAGFAATFAKSYTYYAAVNSNDIVPMGWANLNGILGTYPPPAPVLKDTNYYSIYKPLEWLSASIPTYTAIAPSNPDLFTITPIVEANDSWTAEAGYMHSMQLQYFPHATGTKAPPLPGVTKTGVARPRAVAVAA
ncbi:lipase family protein [Bradyrhizobium oligotrophicum]|uniref:lipase family protein n=1 Tax=Bradyrhizobium oligotrophicum TaxID=44255 RepID=UPI003EBE6EAA